MPAEKALPPRPCDLDQTRWLPGGRSNVRCRGAPVRGSAGEPRGWRDTVALPWSTEPHLRGYPLILAPIAGYWGPPFPKPDAGFRPPARAKAGRANKAPD